MKFNGPFVGDTIEVKLIDGNSNRWTFVDEFEFVSPEVEGSAPWQASYTVKCENLTTATSVVIPKTKSPNWNCEVAGLVVKSGDRVRVTIDGKRY